ncbi:MAG: hypothetical protein ABSG15_12045 [FCB group bacterium]
MITKNLLIRTIIIISLFAPLLMSCSFSTYYVQTGSRVYEEVNPENVKIYSGEPKEEYIVIASIAVDHYGDNEAGIRYLQEKAALIGADAVIFTKLSSFYTNRNGLAASGVAVKFKK